MKKTFLPSLLALVLSVSAGVATTYAQTETAKTDPNAKAADNAAKAVASSVKDGPPAVSINATTSPIDLARAALAAQGGDAFKNLKNMVLRGSVDLYRPNSTQSMPGGFVWVVAGEKLRLEINAPPASFIQVYDGQQSYISLPGLDLPPASKFGLPLLARIDQPGYTVSALPDKKKQRAFRVADPAGNVTDFYVDATSGRVMTFLIPYNGFTFGTDNSKFKEIEGVLVPVEFTQRLETPQGAFFAEYKVKDVKLNQALGDDVFAMPH
jgi:hypothetical protein